MIDIVGYNGKYKVTSDGRVYSFHKELKQSVTTTGYLRVNLNNKDGGKTFKVHRLVAIYFLPNPMNYKCVNHIDGNKLNNDVSNLEWCTYTYNNRHARKTGLCTNPKGVDSALCRKVIRKDTGQIYNSLDEAVRHCKGHGNTSGLSNHLNGRARSFHGCKWEYL